MLPPHGGQLVDRKPKTEQSRQVLMEKLQSLPELVIDQSTIKDLQNIADGSYSPLTGFMTENDFRKVVYDKTLEDGTVWTVPITLNVSRKRAKDLSAGQEIALSTEKGEKLALLELEEMYSCDKTEIAEELYGTVEREHPGVANFFDKGDIFLGGSIRLYTEGFRDFQEYYLRPVETRVLFKAKGWDTVVGFQTRNVPHRGHEHLQKSALEVVDGILIHPKIGRKKEGDWQDEVILKAYKELLGQYYLKDHAAMSIFPANMHYMGPREAVFDAIVRKNFGCTHFIVGRDHAGVGDYYGDFEAHQIFDKLADIDIHPLTFDYAYYCTKCGEMVTNKTCPHPMSDRVAPSGTKIRGLIRDGTCPPEEIMRPEVAEVVLEEKNPFVVGG